MQTQSRASCADLLAADKFGGGLWLTLPRPLTSLSGQDVMIYPSIYPWTGPGAYTSRAVDLVADDGFITVDGVRYRPGTAAPSSWQARATVSADGSGSLNFSGMVRDGDPKRTLSGELTWTCAAG